MNIAVCVLDGSSARTFSRFLIWHVSDVGVCAQALSVVLPPGAVHVVCSKCRAQLRTLSVLSVAWVAEAAPHSADLWADKGSC